MTAQVDPQQVFKTLCGLMKSVVNDATFDAVQTSLEENTVLKQTLETQKSEWYSDQKSCARILSNIQKDLDAEKTTTADQASRINALEEVKTSLTSELEAEKAKVNERDDKLAEKGKTNSDLQEKLNSARSEIESLKNVMKEQDDRHNELSSRFATTSAELDQRKAEVESLTTELEHFKQYSHVMKKAPDDVIVQKLEHMFETVHSLATTVFSKPLPQNVLENTELWQRTRQRLKWLPLPPSNTREAKQMRIAAFVGAMGSQFAKHIFTPIYVNPNHGEMLKLLSDLSLRDPAREVHLRSVLLDVETDQQKDIRRSRAVEIVNTLYDTFGSLLCEEQKGEFKTKLQKACIVAIECWEFIRQVETKVGTEFPSDDSTEDNDIDLTDKSWVPIRLPQVSTDKVTEPNGTGQPKGSAKTNGNGNGNGKRHSREREDDEPQATNGVHIEEMPPTFGHSDIKSPVWPGFWVGENLVKGQVLLNAQVNPARAEMGSRRIHRKMLRNSSVSRPPRSLIS